MRFVRGVCLTCVVPVIFYKEPGIVATIKKNRQKY